MKDMLLDMELDKELKAIQMHKNKKKSLRTKKLKNSEPKSSILKSVHEAARDLHKMGHISDARMRAYDAMCLEKGKNYTPEKRKKTKKRKNEMKNEQN